VSVIPEPDTFLLMVLGLIGVMGTRAYNRFHK
jgi:hypothetical protein